jgi:Ca2+-binding EF-hand superfamily protein
LDIIDTDRNGKINYTEFISSCLENSIVYKEENLLSVFIMLDRDKNGWISASELKAILGKGPENDKKE